MVEIKKYLQALYDAMDGIAEARYLGDRPKAVDEKKKSFIVVDLPNYISNREIDRSGSAKYFVTTASIDLFVRDKVTSKRVEQVDINLMDALLQKILEKFPIKNKEKGVYVSNPRIILSSSDGNGFHYTSIQARLTTYF